MTAEQRVIVSFSTRQADLSGQANTLRITTEGQLQYSEDLVILSFYVADPETNERTETIMHFDPQEQGVNMIRSGGMDWTTQFRAGERYISHMDFPFGRLDIELFTQEVKLDLGPQTGEVSLRYNLAMGEQEPFNYEVKISYNS